MSVLLEALHRANQRKMAVTGTEDAAFTYDHFCMMVSGFDLDPADLAGYTDVAAAAFIFELQQDAYDLDVIVRGILAEGLLMGLMIARVHDEAEAEPERATEPTAPSISATAKTLASLLLMRAQQLAVQLSGDRR